MKEGVSLKSARAAKRHAGQVFASLVGEEVAVGITSLSGDLFGLKINLTTEPSQDVELPPEIEGVAVQIEVVGEIRKR